MRTRLVLVSFLVLCSFATAQVVFASESRNGCALRPGLLEEISKRYSHAKVLALEDLDERDRNLFQKEHTGQCPGVVKLDFYGDGKLTWGVVLLTGEQPKRKARLVIAREIADSWEIRLIETTDGTPVVWIEGPGKYEDVYGQKTLRAAHPVIVFCGYESWAILYAWTGSAVDKVWLSD